MTFQSYSQLNQDIDVANFFNLRRGGYFIEVGAYDGIYLSNTYMLESELGWKGICVEPMPSAFSLLQKNRSCICVQTAAYSECGLNLEFAENDITSGLVKHIDHHVGVLNSNRINVQTKTLTNIMNEYDTPNYIEYLSIDTEGSELEVMHGIDWGQYSFGYINIEHNYIEPRRTEMRRFLEEKGYTYLRENQWDDDYILKDKIVDI